MSFDFKRRLAGLQEKMKELDLVIYGSCQNFQYLTGFLIDWRRGIDLGSHTNNVFVPRKGTPVLTLGEDSSERAEGSWIKDVRILEKDQSHRELVGKVISDLVLVGSRKTEFLTSFDRELFQL